MPLIEFKGNPTPKELRQFGLLWLPVICLTLAATAAFRSQTAWGAALAAGGVFCLLIAIWQPRSLRPINVLWTALAFPFGWLLAHLLLAAIYFLLITPIGLILRIVRRDPLAREFEHEAQSYWTKRPASDDRARYFRQY
jgi:hypothetical protein